MMPSAHHRFFWDCSPDQLDVDQNAPYIIERLMESGDMDAVRWMLGAYPREKIIQVLKSTRSLTPKSAHFWAFYYNINPSEVPCTRKSWFPQRHSASKH